MSFLGEAILSTAVSLLIQKLASPDLLKLARKAHVHKELKKWGKILHQIYAVLDDAEEKLINNRLLKFWLEELRELAYDVEDILDEFSTEVLRQNLREKQESNSSKLWSVLHNCCGALNPKNLAFNYNWESRIKTITARLEGIVKQKDDLELCANSSQSRSGGSFKRLPSTSLLDEQHVFGRKEDRDRIVELLLSREDWDNGVCVIPIIGMGGIGKTTLAQLVYNDERVMSFFDLRAWVYVSEDFDVARVTKTILEAITLESLDAKDFNLLQVRLRDRLMGKKFLIVLDDVWNENYEAWALLCRTFKVRCPSSKIIVTARNEGVADIMRTVPSLHLEGLSFNDCLSLFANHALGRKDFDSHPHLKEIGKEIVQRCRGLPLAVKTLGGLLRTKPNVDEWENILNSKLWDLPEDKSGIIPALRLSYYHLPSHLKQIFAFCSIFPKGYGFYRHELVLLWISEGFFPQPEENKQVKDLYSCFNELLSRSFFQRSSSTEPLFVMHDLISDLAQYASGEICVSLNDKLEDNKHYSVAEKTRHVSFNRHTYEIWNRFKDLVKQKHLRTLIALPTHPSSWAACCYLSDTVLYEAISKLRCLRVLSLSGYCISRLPNSISGLKHLRYLNLSCSEIEQLPESVTTLLNLQILILFGCRELCRLPQNIGDLINLCHLDVTDTFNLNVMPPGIGNLIGLWKLSKFIVGKDNGCGIRELKELNNLEGRLSILDLHNVIDVCQAFDANLRNKHYLTELELEWSRSFGDLRNKEHETQVLKLLQPHTSLKELKISFYGGTKFPSWIGDPSFAKIVHLKLCCCRNCTSLPPLGRLPLLRNLHVEGMDAVKTVGHEFYWDGSPAKLFPSLETLKFENMKEWEKWLPSTGVDKGAGDIFPRLHKLYLLNCPKLVGKLHCCLPSLVKLTICKCPILEDSLISLPSLQELHLEECSKVVFRNMVDSTSITSLRIQNMSDLTNMQDLFIRSLTLRAPKVLVISNCTKLMNFGTEGIGLEKLMGLERLVIEDCPQFVSLAEKDQAMSPRLDNLEFLGCNSEERLSNSLGSVMPFRDSRWESCIKDASAAPQSRLWSTLRQLVLRNCRALESLPPDIMMFSCQSNKCLLEDLEIEDCPLLEYFPRGRLPTTLKMLKIRYCTNLKCLPEGLMHNDNSPNDLSHLEQLEIVGCPSLASFPAGKLGIQLKQLKIWDCMQLESLSGRMMHESTSLEYVSICNCKFITILPESPHSLINLTDLNISNCSSLVSFPETTLFLPNLRTLSIYDCVNLKSLPTWMRDITSLQELTISGCPGATSFLRGDFPPNLISLELWDCENFDGPTSEWNLHSLSRLRDFSISGGCLSSAVCFPDDKCVLPPSLISVWIGRLPCLESLSMQLQSLTSLEELEIVACPKLWSLPKEGLTATLGRFSIRDCPLLKKRCNKEKGVLWPMIAHIPCVEMDGEDVMN